MPSPAPFLPYNTLFKLPVLGHDPGWLATIELSKSRDVVACLNCNAEFPLTDLLRDELRDDLCPACDCTADEYWRSRPHRTVPEVDANGRSK